MNAKNRVTLAVVLGLLGATAVFMGIVAVAVVRASLDTSVRGGLEYDGFLAAVDELIEGAGDEGLVRFTPVEEALRRGHRVTYDTLVIEADAIAFPSFARAGFLYDQVQTYNRFQRERVALARTDPEWFDRLEGFNPSIFRSRRGGGESVRLSRAPAAWALQARSPFEGDWMGEIRAHDVHRGAGLIGPRVAMSLRRPTRLVRSVDGRRQRCEFIPGSLDVSAYCLSEQRIPQAILRMASNGETPTRAVAGWTEMWVDGGRIAAGDSVAVGTGAILEIDPLEPVVLAEYWEGILSSEQWVNGRTRRVGSFQPPLDMFAALGRRADLSAEAGDASAPIELSIHAEASRTLTTLLGDYVDARVDEPVDFGMIVLASVPDGRIVAVAEIGDRISRGRSNLLEPVTPGSAVKPLLAAAILTQRPDLASLRIPARSREVTRVLGLPAITRRQAFSSTLNCAAPRSGWIDLRYFLGCSNNEYAASLLAASLFDPPTSRADGRAANFSVEGRGYASLSPAGSLSGRTVSRPTLLLSPLSDGLNELFDVPTDPVIADATRRSRRVWLGLSFGDGRAVDVPYELLPAESRPALLASASSEGTDLSLLYRYAYGAWENRWTLLDLTNAFGRLATDRRVQLSFAGTPSAAAPEDLGLGGRPWYRDFMRGLRDVGIDGTASGLVQSWRATGVPGDLLAKTGTLAEPGEPGPRDDLFLKSLLFTVGPTGEGSGQPVECGIAGAVYLRFREGPRSGSLPSYQVDFASRSLGAYLAEHWEAFGICGAESDTERPGDGFAAG